jgi:hypothetical protein
MLSNLTDGAPGGHVTFVRCGMSAPTKSWTSTAELCFVSNAR